MVNIQATKMVMTWGWFTALFYPYDFVFVVFLLVSPRFFPFKQKHDVLQGVNKHKPLGYTMVFPLFIPIVFVLALYFMVKPDTNRVQNFARHPLVMVC